MSPPKDTVVRSPPVPTEDLVSGDKPTPLFPGSSPRGAADTPTLAPGLRIGPYRIEREIGHGGMGAVYLAVRADDAFSKRVALKVIRGALGTPEAVLLFKRERQILAHLEHPNIARILDGGATDEGLPYFVMEYIEGRPLHEHCDRNRLDTRQRLALFLQVAEAVGYAHRNLVVHRDLKPGNVLVTAEGVPRLLDFGIAKLIDPEGGEETLRATALAFTPWYASPEQVEGGAITTATDVYSLGVLLYELLTGHGPYRLGTSNPLDVLKAVVEQEPERPSAAIDRTAFAPGKSAPADALTPWAVSLTREGSPQKLRARLRGDLDAILMTALRKEPARRYPSVEAFAEDIRRCLAARPVSARPDSAFYRTGKFLKRHRAAVVAAGLAALLVAGAAANMVVQSRRVARERDRAERVQRFLVELFSVSDPSEARGSTVTAREVLDRGAERIAHELREQPAVRADLMEAMADVYNRLGLNDKAAALAREALLARRTARPAEPKALSHTLNLLGSILMDKGDASGAEAAYRETLALREEHYGKESLEVAQAQNNLGGILDTLGRYDESDRLQNESLATKRRLLGSDHPSLATGLFNLAVSVYRRGDLTRAEQLFREALAIQRRAYGENHPEVAFTMQSLGVILDDTSRYSEAEKIYREALHIQRQVLGQEHPDIVTTLTNLGMTLMHARRDAEALAVLREALSMSGKVYGDRGVDTAHVLAGLAEVEWRQGDVRAAEAHAALALSIREEALGLEHRDTAEARVLHGRLLLEERRFAEAETALRRGYEDLEKQEGLEARRREAREALVRLYERWGKPKEAGRYRTSPDPAASPGQKGARG